MTANDAVTHSGLAEALAKAQADFPPITKGREVEVTTKSGGRYTYRYAELADIIAATTPALSSNGLAVSQPLRFRDGQPLLATVLLHTSGERLEAEYPLNINGTPQEAGSAITYARRYSLCALLGITAEDDDDGQAASKPKAKAPPAKAPTRAAGESGEARGSVPGKAPTPRPSPADPKHSTAEVELKAQRQHLWALAKSRGMDADAIKAFASERELNLEELDDVARAIAILQTKEPVT